jgi:serine phosphatase RsbU (regulator of sigma subunit)
VESHIAGEGKLVGPRPRGTDLAGPATPHAGPSRLSEAAARIGSTLDLTQTARDAVDAAVPGFAEAAVIYVPERLLAADEFGSYQARHVAVVRRLAAALAGQPADVTEGLLRSGEVLVLGEGTPCFRAMAVSSPVLYDQLDVEAAERLGRCPGGREIAASFTSFLAVPLVARGSVVGCAAFGRTPASAPFGPDDVALAAELASRAAICIDNARLYDRERRTALALQSSLLPGRPQVPAGLEVAHRYLPVGTSMVGGDWHDIIALPAGRAALIVGDAMGHGPAAAAVMVQLRIAARILADLGLPPEQVLQKLDRMASELPAPFATCIYTVIDPAGSLSVAAQAGHLPPVLALPGCQPRLVDLPPGLPLGLVAGSFQASQISLPPGGTLALYTDGLVESRSRSLGDGMAALCGALGAALARPGGTLDDACQLVTEMMHEHGEDDITLVLARIRR